MNAANVLYAGRTSVLIGVGDRLGEALLILQRNAGRIFLGRQQKRVGRDDALTLRRNLFRQKSHRHELVLHTRPKNFGDLAQGARNLVQARDVVFVMLDRIERHRQRQIGEIGVDADLLVDRHLILFEAEVGDALLQNANHQIVRELVLIGELSRRDRLQPFQEPFVRLMSAQDGRERVVGELVVVAIVAESRRTLRKIAQIAFVLLVEERVLRRQAFGDGFRSLRKGRRGCGNQNQEAYGKAHKIFRVNQSTQRVNSFMNSRFFAARRKLGYLDYIALPLIDP